MQIDSFPSIFLSLSLFLSVSLYVPLFLSLKVLIFAHPNKQSDATRKIIIYRNMDSISFSVLASDIH
jgi:hypothetical protein